MIPSEADSSLSGRWIRLRSESQEVECVVALSCHLSRGQDYSSGLSSATSPPPWLAQLGLLTPLQAGC